MCAKGHPAAASHTGPVKLKGPVITGPDAPKWALGIRDRNVELGFNPDGSKKPGATTGGEPAPTSSVTPLPGDKLISNTGGAGSILGG
jgi:hypothetical protein